MRFQFIALALFSSALLCLPPLQAQAQQDGPIIYGYGHVYTVEQPGFPLYPERLYQVVFDISASPTDPAVVNASINTLARFLNMHAQAGIPADQLRVAAVLHGKATDDGLVNSAYRKRHQVDNPNLELLRKLKEAGARIYVCGQSAAHHGIGREELDPSVKIALSAMTVLVTLQADGYQLIRF